MRVAVILALLQAVCYGPLIIEVELHMSHGSDMEEGNQLSSQYLECLLFQSLVGSANDAITLLQLEGSPMNDHNA